MKHTVKITHIRPVTHNVQEYKIEKPEGYTFIPGQATDVAINQDKWKDEKRPFTFTSLPEDDYLEFVIKSYSDHDGVTNRFSKLEEGDELNLEDAWGAIEYKGKGVFIAGGAGVTPFIGIFKSLEAQGKVHGNSLIFANKTGKDVILEAYFRDLLGENFISILEKEQLSGHDQGRIDKEYLKKNIHDFSQHFYICGPDKMVQAISESLEELGAKTDGIIFEK
jgi:ferredoxin-NADP reductase